MGRAPSQTSLRLKMCGSCDQGLPCVTYTEPRVLCLTGDKEVQWYTPLMSDTGVPRQRICRSSRLFVARKWRFCIASRMWMRGRSTGGRGGLPACWACYATICHGIRAQISLPTELADSRPPWKQLKLWPREWMIDLRLQVEMCIRRSSQKESMPCFSFYIISLGIDQCLYLWVIMDFGSSVQVNNHSLTLCVMCIHLKNAVFPSICEWLCISVFLPRKNWGPCFKQGQLDQTAWLETA